MASCRLLVAILRLAISREDVDPRREYTLAELEDESGAALIERYLILIQIHVYLSPPELGKGWCVRGNPAVPMIASVAIYLDGIVETASMLT